MPTEEYPHSIDDDETCSDWETRGTAASRVSEVRMVLRRVFADQFRYPRRSTIHMENLASLELTDRVPLRSGTSLGKGILLVPTEESPVFSPVD